MVNQFWSSQEPPLWGIRLPHCSPGAGASSDSGGAAKPHRDRQRARRADLG
jgi:hypothetical protein